MKKIILSILVLGVVSMNAQDNTGVTGFKKGDIAITTGLNYNTSQRTIFGNTLDVSKFSISPELMYMFKDNWGFTGGVQFGSGSYSAVAPATDDTSFSNFGLMAGIKHFFTPANRLSFYLGGGAMVNFGEDFSNVDSNGFGAAFERTMFSLNFNPGVNYFIHNNWAVGAELNLAKLSVVSPEVGETITDFTIMPDNPLGGITFRVSYVFKK